MRKFRRSSAHVCDQQRVIGVQLNKNVHGAMGANARYWELTAVLRLNILI